MHDEIKQNIHLQNIHKNLILGVYCIIQISNNFFHGNDFSSSQLIDFQRFENNFYCLVLCFVKTSTIEVFIRCTSYKVKNGTNIF